MQALHRVVARPNPPPNASVAERKSLPQLKLDHVLGVPLVGVVHDDRVWLGLG